MFKKILIANRGEIACRVIRTARRMGIATVAVYSEADIESLHVRLADEAVCIGPAAAAESYLSTARVLDAARGTGAEAIHPGYGFLSENAEFAEACQQHGIVFIGPTPAQMRAFGLKHTARELALRADVPLLPGTGLLGSLEEAVEAAGRIGYPVMLKSTAGGGGIGMRLCRSVSELESAYASVKRLSENNFKNGGLYIEKFVERARHVEVQVFGDGRGNVVSLGERDCSVQRRNQKVIEETPAPGLSAGTRQALAATAVRLAASNAYLSAGTVEYVLDADTAEFYFLEVNTRLQVEHGVTEEVFGVDLVEWMIRAAQPGFSLPPQAALQSNGHAIQVRVYAEDPAKNFQPSTGVLTAVELDAAPRVETWVERGVTVTPYYDPLLAKLIVKEDNRQAAIAAMTAALDRARIDGIETNLAYLGTILRTPAFAEGRATTQMLASMPYQPRTIDIMAAGIQTTVQDYPGRLGLWNVGVPPSGPMDAYAHRLANHLVGNDDKAATLEMTLEGATIKFNFDCTIALTGADVQAEVSGPHGPRKLGTWRHQQIRSGETLRCGGVAGGGVRAYLAFAGGIDVPEYLHSRATFTLGNFGGHGGRALRAGDVLKIQAGDCAPRQVAQDAIPAYGNAWHVAVHYGPHGAPDFFTDADVVAFFSTDWEVHFNSSRTGVRLIGPKPAWARSDGGEAGLHPSNIHDNPYAIGSIDFTGDMPVILGPDGPSLGGFVCPAVIVSGDLWKIGQLRPGDKVRFVRVSTEQAAALRSSLESVFDGAALKSAAPAMPRCTALTSVAEGSAPDGTAAGANAEQADAVIGRHALHDGTEIVYRRAGDDYLLIEFGQPELDIGLRMRAHALMLAVEQSDIPGLIDLTPGIRSLQLHFDHRQIPAKRLITILDKLLSALPAVEDMVVPSRIVYLPLAWNDSQTRLAIQKYQTTVREDAPWCPSNIEFIRRINGLPVVDDVFKVVFDASYMVLGLGDVYLGAPVATPLDPRHRLVTTKYNPARTWTPENAVGIGGAYLCVYGMEGPGGYQFVGRTIQMWNRYRQTASFRDEKPWLLRLFDQIRFYEVTEEELLAHRRDFPLGRFDVRIEETSFSLAQYNRFLTENGQSIEAFRKHQQAAFHLERERWREAGHTEWIADDSTVRKHDEIALPEGTAYVTAVVPGSVWKIVAPAGGAVKEGDVLAIFESMKMEIPVVATHDGVLLEWLVSEGKPASAGQNIAILESTKTA
jgi:urea carboxylase